MAVIQIPASIINVKLTEIEDSVRDYKEIIERFKKTRELGHLFDLVRIVSHFWSQEYYFINTSLNSEQKQRFLNIVKTFNDIAKYSSSKIFELRKCKV